MSGFELDYKTLFDATPTAYLVLTPELVIVAMNRAHERLGGRRREDVVGRDIFEAFPDNPQDPTATGVANLRASLERVLATKQADRMPVQKYDVLDPASDTFVERWWSPVNVPVLDNHDDVVLLLHRVTEVTEWMQVRARRQEAVDATFDEADSDLYAQAQELHAAWMQASADVENFRAAMRSQRTIGQAVGMLMVKMSLTADDAFAQLVVESQHRNVKLREIAEEQLSIHAQMVTPSQTRPG